jgi:hypothetical protein
MENSIFYKEKYLKYKRQYLKLKEQIGAKSSRIFKTYHVLYVILDMPSYEAVKRKIIHNELSIEFIDKELSCSGLKMVEDDSKVVFLNKGKKVGASVRSFRRHFTSSVIDVKVAEYKLKDGMRNNTICTMGNLFNEGVRYDTAEFINKVTNGITLKLLKKTNQQTIIYSPIQPGILPFYGTMLFKYTFTSCNFIEAKKLMDATNDDTSQINMDALQLETIASIGDANNPMRVKLVNDNEIFTTNILI